MQEADQYYAERKVMVYAVLILAVLKAHLLQRLADACLYGKPPLVSVRPRHETQMGVLDSIFLYAVGVQIELISVPCCCSQLKVWIKALITGPKNLI